MMKKYSALLFAFVLLFATSAFAQQVKPEPNYDYIPIINQGQHSSLMNAVSTVTFDFTESDGYSEGSVDGQNNWAANTDNYNNPGLGGPDARSPILTSDFSEVGDFAFHFPNVAGEDPNNIYLGTSPQFDVSAGEGYYSVTGRFRFTDSGGTDIRFYGIDDNSEAFAFQIVIDWLGQFDHVDYNSLERVNMGSWEGSNDYQTFEIKFDPFGETVYYLNGEQRGTSFSPGIAQEVTSVRVFSDNYHEGETFHLDEIVITREIADDPVELGDFGLLTPPDGAEFSVNEGSEEQVIVEWEISENAETYTWLANVTGAGFDDPLLSLASDNGGTANMLTLTEGAIYDILNSFGFENGDVVTLDWTVVAAAGENTLQSEDVFNIAGITMVGAVSTEPIETVDSFALEQNYPNPFNPTTNISFSIPETSAVTLEVYNMQGQRVATIANGTMAAGSHNVSFDAANLSSGIYLYRLTAGALTATNKMMLIK